KERRLSLRYKRKNWKTNARAQGLRYSGQAGVTVPQEKPKTQAQTPCLGQPNLRLRPNPRTQSGVTVPQEKPKENVFQLIYHRAICGERRATDFKNSTFWILRCWHRCGNSKFIPKS